MNWRGLDRADLGFLGAIDDCIAIAESRHPGVIPDLRQGGSLVVASDYGGEHPRAQWATYCFLAVPLDDAQDWAVSTRALREDLLPDGRRMAFKSLGDRVRAQALPSFLASADELNGFLACFAVKRSISSLFGRGRLDPRALESEPLRPYRTQVAEKLLRITHFLALLIAGISAPNQNLVWLTDEDSIASTQDRLRTLAEVFGRVTSAIVPHGMKHLRVATAAGDPGDRSIEDLLAIPDFAAGMLADLLSRMLGKREVPSKGVFLARPEGLAKKVDLLGKWFTDDSRRLRRIVVLIDETREGRLRATHVRLEGKRDANTREGA